MVSFRMVHCLEILDIVENLDPGKSVDCVQQEIHNHLLVILESRDPFTEKTLLLMIPPCLVLENLVMS